MKQKPFIMPPYKPNKVFFSMSDSKSTKEILDALGIDSPESYKEYVSIGDVIYNAIAENDVPEKVLESAISEIKSQRAKQKKDSDKEVLVPKYVADWYDKISFLDLKEKLSQLYTTENKQIQEWVKSESEAQEIVAKMHMFDYGVSADPEFIWHKKSEYLACFEDPKRQYLSHDKYVDGYYLGPLGPSITLASEDRAKEILGDSFHMFEKGEVLGSDVSLGHGKKFDPGVLA